MRPRLPEGNKYISFLMIRAKDYISRKHPYIVRGAEILLIQ